jgi:peptide/nickel transport system permease protein
MNRKKLIMNKPPPKVIMPISERLRRMILLFDHEKRHIIQKWSPIVERHQITDHRVHYGFAVVTHMAFQELFEPFSSEHLVLDSQILDSIREKNDLVLLGGEGALDFVEFIRHHQGVAEPATRCVHGTRLTLLVAVIAVGVGGAIGSLIGIFSGYVRGKIDAVVNVVFSAILSIPNLVLALGLVAVLATAPDVNSTVSSWKQVFVVILSLTIVIIPILGRIARGATLSWSNREFVTAAKSMGAKNSTILWKHIVPNVLPAVMAIAFLAVGVVIVAEGSLSLLGVGIPDGNSWGAILAAGRNDMEYTPHVIYFPIICIALTVISCNQIGDVIRQSLDKREARI